MHKSPYLRRNVSNFWIAHIALLYWTAFYGYRHLLYLLLIYDRDCFVYICKGSLRIFFERVCLIFLGQAQLILIYTIYS